MIIARSPLRLTLGGGGTDLPSYYEKFGGFLIAAAIDKYVYLTLHETFVIRRQIRPAAAEGDTKWRTRDDHKSDIPLFL